MRPYLIIISVIFLCSCKQRITIDEKSTSTKAKLIEVNVMEVNENIIKKPSTILDVLEYIPLETNKDIAIGEISKILFSNGKFILHDKLAKRIYIYSNDGNYLSKITSIGKGYGEFLNIDAFDFDKENNSILIFDNQLRKLLLFNLDGNLITEKKFDISLQDITKLKEGIYFNTEFLWNKKIFINFPEQFQLCYFTMDENTVDGELIKHSLSYLYNDFLCLFPRSPYRFSSICDTALYIDNVNNKIYNLFPDGVISERYNLHFGEFTIPFGYEEINSKDEIENLVDLQRKNKLAVLFRFLETDKSICIRYSFSTIYWTYFYSKTTGRTVNLPLMFSDYDGIQIPMPVSSTDSTYISVIDAFAFKQTYESTPGSKSERVISLYNKLKPNDNPILVIIKLRKDF